MHKVITQYITGSVINSALLKDQILSGIKWKILSVSDKDKSATNDIILSGAIVPRRFCRFWHHSRIGLTIREAFSRFDVCFTLRASDPLSDSHHKFFLGSRKMVKKSEIEIMILHADLDQKNLQRPSPDLTTINDDSTRNTCATCYGGSCNGSLPLAVEKTMYGTLCGLKHFRRDSIRWLLCFFAQNIFFNVSSFFQQSGFFFHIFRCILIDMYKRFWKKRSNCWKKLPTSRKCFNPFCLKVIFEKLLAHGGPLGAR